MVLEPWFPGFPSKPTDLVLTLLNGVGITKEQDNHWMKLLLGERTLTSGTNMKYDHEMIWSVRVIEKVYVLLEASKKGIGFLSILI